MIPTEVAELAQQLALAAGRAEYNDDDIAKAFAMHKVAEASWNAARAIGLADSEEDSGPWPPTAGQFGWQEDDSEACRRVELAKAGAAIDALAPAPVGETRALLERIAAVRARKDFTPQQANAGLLTVLDDCAAALSTTPARAEAQDEGAEPWGWAVTWVERPGIGLTSEVQMGAEHQKWAQDRAENERGRPGVHDPKAFPLYTHPSPTPAADADDLVRRLWAYSDEYQKGDAASEQRAKDMMDAAGLLNYFRAQPDRVRIMREGWAAEMFDAGHTVCEDRWTDRHVTEELRDRYRRAVDRKVNEALAALKSTAAKEGA